MILTISNNDSGVLDVNLDTNQLRAFVAVAELKSFSKASQRLCRVQSAVSQQIQKLEGQLGAELFIRDRKGLRLTERGEDLLSYALKLLAINDQAVSALTDQTPKGRVRVGTSDTYASIFFADILEVCSRRFPDVEIEVHCGYSNEIWAMYEKSELDIVLTQGCPKHITSELLHTEPLIWACSINCEIIDNDPIPLALFTDGCGDREIVINALNRACKNFRIGYRSTSHAGIHAAVNSGRFVSAILRSTAYSELRILSKADGYPPLGNLDISLAYRDASPTAPTSYFAEVARSYFRSLSSSRTTHVPSHRAPLA